MPIINLTVKGKQAIGDGTKIVCMNADYTVRITMQDCDEFHTLAVKKLVVRQDWEYREATMVSKTVGGQTVYEAILPVIERQDDVDIGVCGKESEDAKEPKFTSKPAKYQCDKSVLCGALILKEEPKLIEHTFTDNGTYEAPDFNADGFNKVNISVGSAITREALTVDLNMSGGNQVVTPTKSDTVLSKVTIRKPSTLIPSNVREGVTIGGIKGTYGKCIAQEILKDGEYTPPAGYTGFSKVTVKVGSSNFQKTMHIGDSFTYDYDSRAEVTLDKSGVVTSSDDGNNVIITAVALGQCGVTVKDYDSANNVVTTRYYDITVEAESALPAEVSTAVDMYKYLADGEICSVIKYTGPAVDGFVTGALYIIEEAE